MLIFSAALANSRRRSVGAGRKSKSPVSKANNAPPLENTKVLTPSRKAPVQQLYCTDDAENTSPELLTSTTNRLQSRRSFNKSVSGPSKILTPKVKGHTSGIRSRVVKFHFVLFCMDCRSQRVLLFLFVDQTASNHYCNQSEGE